MRTFFYCARDLVLYESKLDSASVLCVHFFLRISFSTYGFSRIHAGLNMAMGTMPLVYLIVVLELGLLPRVSFFQKENTSLFLAGWEKQRRPYIAVFDLTGI